MQTKKPNQQEESPSINIWQVVVGLLLVNIFLGLWVLLSPEGKLEIAGIQIKSTPANSIFTPPKVTKVSLDTVLASINPLDTAIEFIDSVTLKEQEEELLKSEFASTLEYPIEGSFEVMKQFFGALLETERSGKPMRIMHYGDSQLEGDRITDYLRNRLQLRFGGSGPGILLPLEPTAHLRPGVRLTQSPDWKKMAIYGNLEKAPAGTYGPGAASFYPSGKYRERIGTDTLIRKNYELLDSFQKDTDAVWQYIYDSSRFEWDTTFNPLYVNRETSSSWLKVQFLSNGYPKTKKYKRAYLLYSHPNEFEFSIQSADKENLNRQKAAGAKAGMLRLNINSSDKRILLKFDGQESPLIMGMSFESDSGISIDNFPMRGSSALGFESVQVQVLGSFLQQLNTRLIILQYGINVVPNPQKSYKYYERMLSAQLAALKKAAPFASILVIGPSDMSRRGINGYESYPNIPLIRDAMRNAAFANNCAFWDLYEAMGGQNSMLSWVESEPPLGNKDFTHFSTAGARYVGEMLYKVLLKDFVAYKKSLIP